MKGSNNMAQHIYTVRVHFTIDMGAQQYKTYTEYLTYTTLRNKVLEQRAIDKKLADMELRLCRVYNIHSEIV